MSQEASIMLVADRAETASAWAATLEMRGAVCVTVGADDDAPRRWADCGASLAILDVYAGQGRALALCRALRTQSDDPLLFLCDGSDEATILAAYEAGADEVVLRPVSPLILLAKAHAWMRHSSSAPSMAMAILEREGLRLEPWRRTLTLPDGCTVHLTPLEMRLLQLLMGRPRRVQTAEVILERVWGQEGTDLAQLKNVIYRLRRKIEPDPHHPRYLHTAPGHGYFFGVR